MSGPPDLDAIISAWIEEGPNELPEQTRRAIAVTTRTTEQKRRFRWAPWRTPLMTSVSRVAVAAIAVVALVGGAVYFIGAGQPIGGNPPTVRPTVTSAPSSAQSSTAAQGTVPTDWTTYTSSRFAYSIDYPTTWIATAATQDWPATGFPYPDGPAVDRFSLTRTGASWVFVSSVPLEAGQVAAERIAELDADNAQACRLSGRHTVTIDGLDARQEDAVCFGRDHIVEVVVANNGRFYQIDLFSATPIGETSRATFDRFLASFRFGG